MSALHQATATGAEQMMLAFDAARRRDETFPPRALAFLRDFARQRSTPFSAEDVTDAAAEVGIHAGEQRGWGAIFQRAARAGIIKRSSKLFPRRYGHGSPTLGWERAECRPAIRENAAVTRENASVTLTALQKTPCSETEAGACGQPFPPCGGA